MLHLQNYDQNLHNDNHLPSEKVTICRELISYNNKLSSYSHQLGTVPPIYENRYPLYA